MADTALLADLRPQVQIAIQRGQDVKQRLRGLLLGQVAPDLLLLQGPDETTLVPGERIVVRTLQSGKALGFATIVRQVLERPVRLCFVELPAAVEVLNLRKADRIDVFVPADIRFAAGKGEGVETVLLHGNMLDISSGGCRVYTKRGIPVSTVVSVSFTLPGDRQPCVVNGSVLEAFSQNTMHGQRIKFFASERNVEDLAQIKRWVNQNIGFADIS